MSAFTMKVLIGAAAASIAGLSTVAAADGATDPPGQERLKKPIRLPSCPASIVEWKASAGKAGTRPSRKAASAMDEVCAEATKHFSGFLRSKGYRFALEGARLDLEVSVLPFKAEEDGRDPGNLNDIEGRFRGRRAFPSAGGGAVDVLGFYSGQEGPVYIRNDVVVDGRINPEFIETFAHELFHAMTRQYGLYEQIGGNAVQRPVLEEKLAQEFGREVLDRWLGRKG
jgi:hypothetical protein